MAEPLDFGNLDLDTDTDSDIDENYHDVEENIPTASEADILSSVRIARSAFFQFLNDEPDKAMERIKFQRCRSVYHAHMHAVFAGLQAFLSFKRNDMESAVKVVRECTNMIYRRRRGITWMIRPNYNSYTEEEVHAEVLYADCLLIRAFLTIFQDGNLMSYLKEGLRVRMAFHVYKECQKILDNRTWNNDQLRSEFESAVDLGIGSFNWFVAGLPPRILKILQFIGFSADRDLAFRRLTNGHRKHDTFKGSICTLALFVQSCAARFILGYPKISDSLLEYCGRLLKKLLKEAPKCPMFLYFAGRLEHIKGNIPAAIEKMEKVVHSKCNIYRFQHVPVFELSWIYMAVGDWRKVVHYTDILCRESNWSRSVFYYLKAAALFMCKDRSVHDHQEMIHCMKEVPKYIQRFLGRSLPVEKFCFRRSERFLAQGNWLPVPILEVMYVSNYFYLMKGKKEILSPIMALIDAALDDLQKEEHKTSPWYTNNYCLAIFLKGLTLSYMGYPLSAEEYYIEVVQNKHNIVRDSYVTSFALLELGHNALNAGNAERATEYLNAAKMSSIFMTEFRIHRGFNELRRCKNFQENDNCDRVHF